MAEVYDSDYEVRPEAGRKKRPTVYSDSDAESEVGNLSRPKHLLQSTGSEDESETQPQPLTGRSTSSAIFRKPINAWSAQIPENSAPAEAPSSQEPPPKFPIAFINESARTQSNKTAPYGAQFRLGKEYKKQSKQDMANPEGVGAHTSVFRGSDMRRRPAAPLRIELSLPPPASPAPSTSSVRSRRPLPEPDPLPSPASFHDDLFSAPPTPRTTVSSHSDLPPSTPSMNGKERAPPQASNPTSEPVKRAHKLATTHPTPTPSHPPSTRKAPALSPAPTSAPTRPSAPKPRMLTVLITDRRTDIEELAEIRIHLKPYEDPESGTAYWADAKEVCEKLQGGPSRIDGPAKVYAMRGRYRQSFLRIAPDGTETSQSANLKVEGDRTLSIYVEGLPRTATMTAPASSSAVVHEPSRQLLTPVSSSMSLRDSPTSTERQYPPPTVKSKRKRAGSTSSTTWEIYSASSPAREYAFSPETIAPSPPSQSLPTEVYRSSLPPAPAKKVKNTTPRQEALVHPTPQPASSPATAAIPLSRPSSVASIDPPTLTPLRVPPTEYVAPDDPDMSSFLGDDHGVVVYLTPTLRQDGFGFQEFRDTHMHGQGLPNGVLVKWYGWVQAKVEKYANGSARAPQAYGSKVIEPRHVLTALGLSERWYEVCRETLQLLMAYGPNGQRYRDDRVVAALNDKTPRDGRLGVALPTELLLLLREAHEEWSANLAMAEGA